MKFVALTLVASLSANFSLNSHAQQVSRCEEPTGVAMWSSEGHKPVPDSFKGVKPVVIVDDKEMTIVWGNSKSSGGAEKVWKAVIINRNQRSISAVSVDTGDVGSAVMLYTLDVKRGFLYMLMQKENNFFDTSSAYAFVSTCTK